MTTGVINPHDHHSANEASIVCCQCARSTSRGEAKSSATALQKANSAAACLARLEALARDG